MLKNNRNTDAQRRQRVINLNNAAVSKMNNGKFEQGIQLFSNALRALADTVTRSSPEVDVGSYQVFDDLDSHLSGLLCSVGGCDKMEDGSYMFSRPLSIPRKAAASELTSNLSSEQNHLVQPGSEPSNVGNPQGRRGCRQIPSQGLQTLPACLQSPTTLNATNCRKTSPTSTSE